MRTRVSSGYKISGFITPVLISNVDLMVMSTLDEDQSYTLTLDIQDNNLNTDNSSNVNNKYSKEPDNFLYIQSALLYTPKDGERRIRIHNYCLPMTKRISEVHESIDSEALVCLFTKQLIDKIFKTKKMVNSILSIEERMKSLLSSVFSSSHSLTRELPSHLEYVPLYFLGLAKNRIACKDEINLKMDIDTANYLRIRILRMKTDEIINFLYPKFYQIHHLLVDKALGTYVDDCMQLPEIISTDLKYIEEDGVYLVDNGYALFLYVKLRISPTLLKSFFKVNFLTDIKEAVTEDTMFNNSDELCLRLQNIVEYIRSTKSLYQPLLIVFESTESERL